MQSNQPSRLGRLLAASAVVLSLMTGCQALTPLAVVPVSAGLRALLVDTLSPPANPRLPQPYPLKPLVPRGELVSVGSQRAVDRVLKPTGKGYLSRTPRRRGPAAPPHRPGHAPRHGAQKTTVKGP
jgi:hypothetical protein